MGKRFITVAGNIGVGKSTLTRMLSEYLCWQPFYEAVDDNPYLADFYQDMRRWSFHSQIFFLSRRLRHHRQIVDYPSTVVQDRTVYEDAEIFARNLYQQGLMAERDYASYREMYEAIKAFLPPPDLVIYLRASVPTLLERIRLRGRDYEQGIDPAYLEQLNILYEEWIESFTLCPVLTVPSDELDFVHNGSHLELIATRVLEKLQGKEVVSFAQAVAESREGN
ncbi:MAG: deoxynucleoside kinase [Anaerolineae bacterium]|nr:deoxynucleoside kinase [Anaerolineae bacterium]